MSAAELEAALGALARPDGAARAEAERRLREWAAADPAWLALALLDVAQRSPAAAVAQASVAQLWRALGDGGLDRLPPTTRHQVAAGLLDLLQRDTPEVRAAALALCAKLAPHFRATHWPRLREACGRALQSPAAEVRTSAVELAAEVIQCLEDEQHIETFRQLVPALLAAVRQAVAEADWAAAERSVQAFISVAMLSKFFATHLKAVFGLFVEIAAAASTEAAVRRKAFECVTALAATHPKAVRRLPQLLSAALPPAMQLLLRVGHDPQWAHIVEAEAEKGEGEAEEGDADFAAGVEVLDRLALALGGKYLLPAAAPLVAQFWQDSDWCHRNAAFWALSQVVEGSPEFERLLPQTAALLARGLADPHERVRHAALHCLAGVSAEFRPAFQAAYHGEFLPLLTQRLADLPRVSSMAAEALVNFLDGAEPEHTAPYLDALLAALLGLLRVPPHHPGVTRAVLSAVPAVASHASHLFDKYYDSIVPWLKSIVVAPAGPPPGGARPTEALDCLTRIALAVGKDRFAADAPEVLEAMQRMQSTPRGPDAPNGPPLLEAWGRLAECLGPDLGPYYGDVVPVLLAVLQKPMDIHDVLLAGGWDQPAEEGVERVIVEVKGYGERRFTLNMAAIEEKISAVAALGPVLRGCGPALAPFAPALWPPLLPCLRAPYPEDTHVAAANCLPLLLHRLLPQEGDPATTSSAAAAAREAVAALAEAVRREPTGSRVKAPLLQALGSCVEEGPRDCWGPTVAADLAALLRTVLADSGAARDRLRQQQRLLKLFNSDDGGKVDKELEEEEEVMAGAVDATAALLRREAAFLPHWEEHFAPLFGRLLTAGLAETRLALRAFAAAVGSHCTGACDTAAIFGALLDHCRPDYADPAAVQAACEGLGAGCLLGAPAAAFAPAAVQRLVAVVQHRHDGGPEWEAAVAHAVAALLKALEGQAGIAGCGAGDVLPAVLLAVPVRGDAAAARDAHRRLVRLAGGHAGLDQALVRQRLGPVAEGPWVDEETRAALRAWR